MSEKSTEIRIDKYLWAVRLFKTRTEATEACAAGRVTIAGQVVKPSRHVKDGDLIGVRKNQIRFQFRVLKLLHSRLNAKLVVDYLENITPQDELDKLELDALARQLSRQRGTGRPTKKERRDIDRLMYDDD